MFSHVMLWVKYCDPDGNKLCGYYRVPADSDLPLVQGDPFVEFRLLARRVNRGCPAMTLSRRDFIQTAAAMGASLAWGGRAAASKTSWRERRDLYPEGVASGDPDPNSVILWTRRPFEAGGRQLLTVEVAEDDAFRRVVAKAPAPVSAAVRLDVPRAGRAPQARAHLLVSLHRRRRERQPRRPDDHRAAAERSAAGQFRLRQLPERQRRQAQRLSPDDLRG